MTLLLGWITAPTANMVTAMLTTQPGPTAVERATTQQNRLFFIYFVLLLVVALFTWLVWKAGNRVQQALSDDATARIEEAKSAQKRLEIELSQQRQKTADAERALLELRQRMADRTIRPEQRAKMLAVLKTHPAGKVAVQSLLSEGREALQYADAIASVFREASWTVTAPTGLGSFGHPIAGVFLVVSEDMDKNGSADFLTQVLVAGELSPPPIATSLEHRRGNGILEIWVASK
jgi:hypothetical protein